MFHLTYFVFVLLLILKDTVCNMPEQVCIRREGGRGSEFRRTYPLSPKSVTAKLFFIVCLYGVIFSLLVIEHTEGQKLSISR